LTLLGRERLLALALVFPTIVVVVGVSLGPLLFAGWLSLHDVGINFLGDKPFVGLRNYAEIVENRAFREAIYRTVQFAAVSLLLQLPLGMAGAVLLNQKFAGRNVVRALILIPWAIPTVVNGALWEWIYNTSFGALNGILIQFGLLDKPVIWLGSSTSAMNMVIVADTWKVLPFYMLIFLAGLQTIPEELYDAIKVDGGNPFDSLRHVMMPFLQPFLLIILVLRTMETFRVFDIIYMLTKGGPAGATTVISFYTFQTTFHSLRFGQGASMAFLIGAATLMLALVYFRLLRSEPVQ
jgi:multiple sugar transport system permease protein/N,N'-diacetylchitobiose transport system permease protein